MYKVSITREIRDFFEDRTLHRLFKRTRNAATTNRSWKRRDNWLTKPHNRSFSTQTRQLITSKNLPISTLYINCFQNELKYPESLGCSTECNSLKIEDILITPQKVSNTKSISRRRLSICTSRDTKNQKIRTSPNLKLQILRQLNHAVLAFWQ